jgi:hypothetical protein
LTRYDILAYTDKTGDGKASIAGGQGTMWATALQIGELVEMAEKVS